MLVGRIEPLEDESIRFLALNTEIDILTRLNAG